MTAPLAGMMERFCAENRVEFRGKWILVALSGGRDSVALAHLLMAGGKKQGFSLAAAHYNHHLRPTADRDETFVRDLCKTWGIPLTVGGGDVAAFARKEGLSIEDAARRLRYAFLEEAADAVGADFIATAHHSRDNAETLLLNLLRGAGSRGLGGIAPVRGRIIRPILAARREDIDRYMEKNALPFVEDESNSDTAYARNRLRHDLLPLLEELSPGSTDRIALAAGRLRADDGYLDSVAASLLGEDGLLERKTLRDQHSAVAHRMVRLMAGRFGAELTAGQVESVLTLKTGGCLTLPGGLRVEGGRSALRLYRAPSPPPPLLLQEGEQLWGSWRVILRRGEAGQKGDICLPLAAEPLVLRVWDGTGRFAVENGTRTVKRLLADRGIPAADREALPAIYCEGRLMALWPLGADPAVKNTRGSQCVITLLREDL